MIVVAVILDNECIKNDSMLFYIPVLQLDVWPNIVCYMIVADLIKFSSEPMFSFVMQDHLFISDTDRNNICIDLQFQVKISIIDW